MISKIFLRYKQDNNLAPQKTGEKRKTKKKETTYSKVEQLQPSNYCTEIYLSYIQSFV